MVITPYLFFEGRCEKAADFCTRALGGEVTMLMRYDDSPDPMPPGMLPPGSGSKAMHLSIRVGETVIMASDGRCSGAPTFGGLSLSLTVKDPDEADRLFAALLDGGQVQMPMTKTFFAPRFGMVADRFGLSWMVVVAP